MKKLNDGLLVLYDCKVDFRSVWEIGSRLFEQRGLKPNDMAVRLTEPSGSNATGIKAVRKLSAFGTWVDRADLEYITIASRERGDPSPFITFYYGHDELHSDFFRLIVAYKAKQLSDFDIGGLASLVAEVQTRGRAPYGFACHIDLEDLTQYEYADAQALFVPFLPYEAPDLWKVEVPTYLSGQASPRRYLSGMMRLVYEWNFLNSAHLAMLIEGTNLRDWIGANSSRGTLRELGKDLWAWQVHEAQLMDVNAACAQAGLLVAWKAPEPPRPAARRGDL